MSATETMTLYPYQLPGGQWCFDDRSTGLKEEWFVLGADDAIGRMVAAKRIPDAGKGFAMTFSEDGFAGYDVVVEWTRADVSGNWYAGTVAGEPMDLWLCPALGKYFPAAAPRRIFVRVAPLPEGVEPVWRDDGRGFRYVGG
jgi:hypothetical protein